MLFNDTVNCYENSAASVINQWLSMEQWWNDDRGKPKYQERNLSQCQFAYHKSHTESYGTETRPLRWGADDSLAKPRQVLNFITTLYNVLFKIRTQLFSALHEYEISVPSLRKPATEHWPESGQSIFTSSASLPLLVFKYVTLLHKT
jgi:hypothetical protein